MTRPRPERTAPGAAERLRRRKDAEAEADAR
jgi:hypothetical protein